ncbi:acetyl-CoA C-acyltransferase [Microbacterium timonense]|uniref:acetyl-CoA C-acyltransferase n=1 Tax=Microbacterium timonense TaxID=2086576 RepID=UPI000D0E55FC|nr:acetyl-CoA C-acyltransferase [Microbacterium timonense]
MTEAVIVAIGRSPIARARKGGLVDVRADELATQVFQGVLDQVPDLDPTALEDLYLGVSEPSGEQGFNLARQVAALLGLDDLPGATVNRFCASSLQATRMAYHAIKAGEGHAFLVGGVESISRYPALDPQPNLRFSDRTKEIGERIASGKSWGDPRTDGVAPDGMITLGFGMGLTAENVARMTGTTRADQDEYALRSQSLAARSASDGFFAREIVPIIRPDGSRFTADDSIRPSTTRQGLAALEPAFDPAGTVTAGNCCPFNDGASGAVIVSAEFAASHGLTPLARIVATGVSGLSPEIMGLGPVESSERALWLAGMTIDDIDIVEMNEAFAAQVLPSARQLDIDIAEKLNPFGGSIALGHPYGATGVRLLTTLINGLRTRDQTLGMATLCVGGGQGMAVVVERMS